MSRSVRSRRPASAPGSNQLDLFEPVGLTLMPAPTPTAPPDLPPAGALEVRQIERQVDASPSPRRPDTLFQLLTHVLAGDGSRQTVEMASAIRGAGKVLGKPLAELPADPGALAPLLARANPMSVRMKAPRWSRIQTLLRAALAGAGYSVMPGRDLEPRSASWEQLLAGRSTRIRNGLSRLSKWCSRRGIEPDQVTAEVFEAFRSDLSGASLQGQPDRTYRSTIKVWNEAKALDPAWPGELAGVRPDPRRYARSSVAFSTAFVADVEACLGQSGETDPFAKHYVRALRPATVVGRRRHIYQVATALIDSGVTTEQLSSLADLVKPENAEQALRWLRARQDNKDIPQLAQQAATLCAVAKRWVHASDDDLKTLRGFAAALRPNQKGMRPKNRERLRQFDLEGNVAALLGLPARVVADVEREGRLDAETVRRVEFALAVEILTVAPMRMKNLAAIDIDRHLRIVRRGRDVIANIFIPPEETKGHAPLDMPLPASSVSVLLTWLNRYRGALGRDVGPWLFPGRDGPRNPSAFGAAISDFIKRETGLIMHPHLFRHLATKLHLDFHPDAIETMRRVLGQSSIEITSRAYAEFETARAFKRYGQTIGRRREEALGLAAKATSKKGRAR